MLTPEERQAVAAEARAKSAMIRPINPAAADQIDAAIEDLLAGRRDGLKIEAEVSYKLEKFDGEYEPGKQPVEVIERNAPVGV